MESILEQIERGKLWSIPGGVHPAPNKASSTQQPIKRLPLPESLTIPLKQHIGDNGRLLVKTGDRVLKGQALTEPAGHWSVPVHAPTSGTISEIAMKPTTHPSALPEPSVVLLPDGEDTWCELSPWPDFYAKSDQEIVTRIHNAGISGMGGAGFPAYVKAQPKNEIEFLIINGVECEPYISADDMLMREHASELIKGIEVLRKLYQPTKILIGIEDDKPEAIAALKKACENDHYTQVCPVPTKYPSGGEKQLIQLLTSKHVPQGGIPSDIGMVVHNVGTIFAIYQAIYEGKPLIERVVTVTGETISTPGNVWSLLGTPIKFLLEQSGFQPQQWQRVIMGGPMMGFTLPSVRLPIIKTSNCVLAPSENEMPMPGEEKACIRCSACADACPATLLPQQLQWFAKSKEYDKLEEHNLFDCIECGACAYVCPSEIPLVQYYRVAKAEIRQEREDKVKAERAKERFEARNERLKREQEERQNRHKRAATRTNDDAKSKVEEASKRVSSNDKSAAVQAALARAKAKRSDNGEPDNSEMAKLREERKAQARAYKEEKPAATNNDGKKDAVAAAIARAKAKKAEQANEQDVKDNTSDPRKAAVAAAIARAKAKKEAKGSDDDANNCATNETDTSSDNDPRKAAVAAAIARAKAKKAAQQAEESPTEALDETKAQDASESTVDDPRKAAVAAAIARAKAKKAAKQAEESSVEALDETKAQNADESTDDDPRKAAVAAAIARAKAKKAAKQAEEPSTEALDETKAQDASESTADDPRKAAVAAAIARAKAKKAAKQAEESSAEALDETKAQDASESTSDDPRKAAVAAAIARAKAKKAAKQAAEQNDLPQSNDNDVEQQDNLAAVETTEKPKLDAEAKKKAAIAAAIAKAKAKKAQQDKGSE
ncbi:electron transport complex subunit RsxC [Pseudoalteromonas spongiae]|uniref:Ion-translocating oxidoreductase complex subunit C n=1 Tax=Pseudoalteromonas spongiae TaxID=298657 RepID=A0ABU8ES74_9GAMM